MGQNLCHCAAPEAAAVEKTPASSVETTPASSVTVYGATGNAVSMGVILLVTEKKLGNHVATVPKVLAPLMPMLCNTAKPEFVKMNPFGQIPAIDDGGHFLAESNAILRYLSAKYAPELYSGADAKRRGFIDWAMDSFWLFQYEYFPKLIDTLLFSAPLSEDRAKLGQACKNNLGSWAKFFLQEKFVGGDKLSIADYKVAPFLVCFVHENSRVCGNFDAPDRVKLYVKDFLEACPASGMLTSHDGLSLKEMLDSKGPKPSLDIFPDNECKIVKEDILKVQATGQGKPDLYGFSANTDSVGPLMLGGHLNCIEAKELERDFKADDPWLLKMVPFKFFPFPVLKDGDYSLGGWAAILRYLAATHGEPELYPHDLQKRSRIDWAIDHFASQIWNLARDTLLPINFQPWPRQNQAAASASLKEIGKKVSLELAKYAEVFLSNTKFIGGDRPSIADYGVAPFFYAWSHPNARKHNGVEVPARIEKFNADFASACDSAKVLREGGCSIGEILEMEGES